MAFGFTKERTVAVQLDMNQNTHIIRIGVVSHPFSDSPSRVEHSTITTTVRKLQEENKKAYSELILASVQRLFPISLGLSRQLSSGVSVSSDASNAILQNMERAIRPERST